MTSRSWSSAMAAALYGPGGFYRTNSPSNHFRTSVSASPLLGTALAPLVVEVDDALANPERLDIVDIGAGEGGLLMALRGALPDDLAHRVNLVAVEIRQRPDDLPEQIGWTADAPQGVTGVVIAHEYLDNVPCDVVEVADDGSLHLVLVDSVTGEESAGPALDDQQRDWLKLWWPLCGPGDRAEIGSARDQAWAQITADLGAGLAVAIDYGHLLDQRAAGSFPAGTLTGYRSGRQVAPIPDGSCDITAHVAMDACLRAGADAGVGASALIPQSDALRALGLNARRPPIEVAHTNPPAYIEALSRASQAAELLDPASLGSFWWLLQKKECRLRLEGVGWT